MGGELGSLAASMLENTSWAGPILGIDIDPPRRRLRRSDFRLADPTAAPAISSIVGEFDPQVILHLAVYEPEARASAAQAARWTPAIAEALFTACADLTDLRSIVVRSGIEVYGRPGGIPDVYAAALPTSPFGRQLLNVETLARRTGAVSGVPTAVVRVAPVIGPHVPSPLGRLLRMPVVPGPLFNDPRFTVLSDHDAAATLVAAAACRFDGTVNATAAGSISLRQTLAVGRRLRAPLVGPQWRVARPVSHLLGAPVPDHVVEVLTRGRLAEPSDVVALLGVDAPQSVDEVVAALYSWEPITRIYPHGAPAPVVSR
jgi:UDP-glucose 4-epimerase